jgi:ATP-dependent helicase HrpA
LTRLGRQLASLPVDPRIGRMLLASVDHHCLAEVLIIAAALSVQDPRERPLEKQQTADEIHATFFHESSDFLTFLSLWQFLDQERDQLSRNKFRKLCQRHFLSWNRVQEWRDIHTQLRLAMHEMGFKENEAAGSYEEIHRALLTGLLSNIGFKHEKREYLGARGSRFYIHPGSGLFKESPKWIIAAERVETTRQYGRIVAKVQPGWIESAAAHLVQRSYSEPHWQSKSGQVAAYEKVTLYGVTIVPKRRVNYGPIDPAESREIFLHFALVEGALAEGDFETRAPFWRHNRELIEYVQHLEAKSRRRDILVDEEAIYTFYAQRVPDGIYSKPRFERWLRKATRKDPKLLHMRMTDVMRREAGEITQQAFPDGLQVGATRLPLEYRFDPGSVGDGVTLTVPLPLLNQVSLQRCEWLVPGLLEELLTALLRGLPKQTRKAFVPIPETAKRLAERLTPSDRPLVETVGETLKEMTGIQVSEDAWDWSAVPCHLRMKFRLVDERGHQVAVGEDFPRLKRDHGRAGQQQFATIPSGGLEREGIKRWDFEALPQSLELDRGGMRLRGYPALVDHGDSVAIRVLDSDESAAIAMRAGLRRLLMLHLGPDLRSLRRSLPGLDRMRLQYAKAPKPQGEADSDFPDLADELLALILDLTFLEDRPPIRDRETFAERLEKNRPRLMSRANEVCRLAERILSRYQAIRKRIAGITQSNWMPSLLDMREHLDSLVFRGFLQQIPYEHLQDYPRFLKGLEVRAEKLAHAAGKDQQWMRELAPLQKKWRERSAAAREAGRSDPRLEEIRWVLEELRVSLFAQQLGTAYPVSAKRIETRWRELGL